MNPDLNTVLSFLSEIDKLKAVDRKAYTLMGKRRENSAEHSWHLAAAIWSLSEFSPEALDLQHAQTLALIHDLGEIDPGDTSIFSSTHSQKRPLEEACIERLALLHPTKGKELIKLWLEYEECQTLESQWVKVIDRLLPFLLNISSEGKAWREQTITRTQVIEINQLACTNFPELYEWISKKISFATDNGWLTDQ